MDPDTTPTATPGPIEAPAPTPAEDRLVSVDAIRGLALLGILVPNIISFGWPFMTYFDPGSWMPPTAWNEAGLWFTAVFFLTKMQLLFSMLFGAGVVLFGGHVRDGAGRASGALLWHRRMLWLAAIGLVHAVFIWYGDILLPYAIGGLLGLWWLRRLGPVTLIVLGVIVYFSFIPLYIAFQDVFERAAEMMPRDQAAFDRELEAMRGGVPGQLAVRAGVVAGFAPKYALFLPMMLGAMLIGAGAFRAGLFGGRHRPRFHAWQAVIGLVTGMGATVGVLALLILARTASGEPRVAAFADFMSAAQLVGFPTSFGIAGLIAFLVSTGRIAFVWGPLAAVGRMALSNYLLQSLICTTIFYGTGLRLFGRVDYPALLGIVAGVWVINIALSQWWLARFRFGPAEWAWRTLTYWRATPIRRKPRPAGRS